MLTKTIFIVALDEIDALIKDRGDNILYELTRVNESLHKSKLAIIGISNDLRLKEFLRPACIQLSKRRRNGFQALRCQRIAKYSS